MTRSRIDGLRALSSHLFFKRTQSFTGRIAEVLSSQSWHLFFN
jgi:hypothetical protein